MDIIIWVSMCLFACYGAVELFGRLFYGCRVPRGITRGCLLVPLRNAKYARKELEYYFSFAQWHGLGRPIVFVAEESNCLIREAFDEVMGGISGVYLCSPSRLESFAHSLWN